MGPGHSPVMAVAFVCLSFFSIFSLALFLCMVLESVPVSFFYKWLTSFPSTLFSHLLLRRLSFLHCIFLPPLSKIRCP